MATQNELFKMNITQVLRHIWLNNGVSRVEIAKALKIDKSTITKIVTYLLEANIIVTTGERDAKPRGGRKPVSLGINREYGYIMGIEITTDSYVAVVLDLNGEILFRMENTIDFEENNLMDMFFLILEELKPQTQKFELLGIVLGISGIINSFEGRIIKSNPFLISEELDFSSAIAEKLDIPVFVENDANCCCWGELISLKTQRPETMLFILGEFKDVEIKHTYYKGIGFGFGIVIDGKVYYGHEFSAGEFKSIFSDKPTISQFSLDDDDIKDIQTKPEELTVLLRELCRNISLIINFFNVSDIVIGGEIEQYYDTIELMIDQEVQRNWTYPDQMTYSIKTSQESELTVAYGAASMFLERLFSVPDMNSSSNKELLCGIDLIKQVKETNGVTVKQ